MDRRRDLRGARHCLRTAVKQGRLRAGWGSGRCISGIHARGSKETKTFEFRPFCYVKPCARPCGSLAHRLEDDPLGPLTVPFAVENPLPRTQVQLTVCHQDDDLVTKSERPKMR